MAHRNAYMTDELEAIYAQTIDFVAREITPEGLAWEEAGKVPREVLRRMGSLGMLGLRVPESLGGVGLGPVASAPRGQGRDDDAIAVLRRIRALEPSNAEMAFQLATLLDGPTGSSDAPESPEAVEILNELLARTSCD